MPNEMLESLKALAKHFWRGVHWEKHPDGPRCVREPLKISHLEAHLNGGRGVGLAPITPGTSTTRIALFDLDDHTGKLGWDTTAAIAKQLLGAFGTDLRPRCVRSSGGKGIHIYLLWESPQDAYSVRQLMSSLLATVNLTPGTKGLLHRQVEIFPKQNEVPLDGVGSMWVLPFSRESLPLDEDLNPLDIYAAAKAEYWLHSSPVPVQERPAFTNVEQAPNLNTDELKRLQEALDAIPNTGNSALSYDEWRDVIFAIHDATKGSDTGLKMAEAFTAKSDKHTPGSTRLQDRVWPYIRSDRLGPVITAATVFAKAREHGYNEALSFFDDITATTPEPKGASYEEVITSTQLSSSTEPATPAGSFRFKIHTPAELALRPEPTWLIHGVLPKADLVVLYGESTAGKSFIALDIAYAIANAKPWRGKDTMQGRVVYVCAEGIGGFTLRIRALLQQFKQSTFDVGTMTEAPNFLTVEDVRDVIKAIHNYGPTSLVIVDTLAQVSPGGNENSGEDMGKILVHCRAINRTTGATVMLVHHAGKDLTKGARGWSGLKAAADAELEVQRLDNIRIVRVSKLKDGQDGAAYPFKLLPVPVGMDNDGNVIESCIVEHLPDGDNRDSRAPQLKGEWSKAAYRMSLSLQRIDGSGVPVDELVSAVLKHRGLLGTPDDTRQTRWSIRRAIDNLEERQLLFTDEDGNIRPKAIGEGEGMGEGVTASQLKSDNCDITQVADLV